MDFYLYALRFLTDLAVNAKDFLNWLVFEEDGNAFLTEKCALVPAYSNIDASALDPLSKSVKKYAAFLYLSAVKTESIPFDSRCLIFNLYSVFP